MVGLEPTKHGFTTRGRDHFGITPSCPPRIRTSINWPRTSCPAVEREGIACASLVPTQVCLGRRRGYSPLSVPTLTTHIAEVAGFEPAQV